MYGNYRNACIKSRLEVFHQVLVYGGLVIANINNFYHCIDVL